MTGLPPSHAIDVGGLPLTMEGALLWSLHMPVAASGCVIVEFVLLTEAERWKMRGMAQSVDCTCSQQPFPMMVKSGLIYTHDVS